MTEAKPPLFPDNPHYWFETLRVIAADEYGASQVGEVLAVAGRIKAGDHDSWHDAWKAMADKVTHEADDQLRRGHKVSARDGYLRASNYYRSSEFYLHGDPRDPRIAYAYRHSVDAYRACAALFEPPIEPVEIPYEGATLPGYFHRADLSSHPRTTIVMHSGFDGSAEEMHVMGARAAVERGWNALAFDGPGQFGPLHREGLTFRPDWEKVVTPAIDFVLKLSGVDPERVVLMGASLGGLLAPRAAAFEKRLAAVIANDGVFDFAARYFANVPAAEREAVKAMLVAESAPELDAAFEQAIKTNPMAEWALAHGMYAMGAPNPRAYVAKLLAYNLGGGIAERIACPALICEAEGDLFFKGQPQELYDHLICRKTLMRFTSEEGAGGHCQVGAGRLAFARIYDWVEETLSRAAP